MRHSASLWKRLFLLLAAILLGTALLAGGYLAYVWYRFAPPDAVGARITVPGGTLESVSREWFAQGTAALRGGWLVPPAWRVADAALDQVEVLQTTEDGGFVQLIYNGYGGFIFDNPFAKVLRDWGLRDLAKMLFSVRKLYKEYGPKIQRDCSDEEFMAMFEQYPEFDDYDDEFVENEEAWTAGVAHYVDEHIEEFVVVEE